MIHVRPASKDDVSRFYPGMTATFRAWVCDLDGEVRGLIGVIFTRPCACLVSVFDEALRPYLKSIAILRLIKKAQSAVVAYGKRVLAVAEPGEATAKGMLERLGFVYFGNVDGDEVYQWGGA